LTINNGYDTLYLIHLKEIKMATKSTKSTKSAKSAKSAKTSVAGERVLAPDLNPKDPDIKYTGTEPLFVTQPDADRRSLAQTLSFNWYSRYCSNKDAKEFLAQYCTVTPDLVAVAKELRKVEEREVISSIGFLARMYLRGLDLNEREQTLLRSEINRLVETLAKPTVIESSTAKQTVVTPAANRPNVQEIMRERTRECAGELEGWLDDFITSGAKSSEISVNPVGVLTERNILAQHISILTDIWRRKLAEFEDILTSKDPQVIEAYAHYTKTQIKAVIKFCEAVLAGLQGYITVKKATATPRKKKAQSPEKIASKLKYLKDFAELKLTSAAPKSLVGATEIWLYDTSKRKLHYYVADGHIGTMTVKGTTIMGFDATKSGVKTLRKPADVLKKLMAGGKPASRKVFSEINAVHTQPNGRTNESMIILKAY
jgi:hypothetical protein